jgi:hypothetical protein
LGVALSTILLKTWAFALPARSAFAIAPPSAKSPHTILFRSLLTCFSFSRALFATLFWTGFWILPILRRGAVAQSVPHSGYLIILETNRANL